MSGGRPGGPMVLVGAGGHGRELLDLVEAANAEGAGWEIRGFLSDHPVDEAPIARRGLAVLGPAMLVAELDVAYLLAIGDGRARRSVVARIGRPERGPVSVRHPAADVAGTAAVGEGLVAAAGAVVGARSRLGCHVHLNVNATIAPEAVVGDYATVSPGALVATGAVVGSGAFIGIGATVLPGSRVAPDTMVGAGAVVQGTMPPSPPLVGNPAHPTR